MKSIYQDPKSASLRLVHLCEELDSELLQGSFTHILAGLCRIITESGASMMDTTLDSKLYTVLNLKPLSIRYKEELDDTYNGKSRVKARDVIKEEILESLRELMPWVSRSPIYYDEADKDIAEMHFSGALGLWRKTQADYPDGCSLAVKDFDLTVYQQIRAAKSLQEISEVTNRAVKLSVLHILTGFYIDWYAITLSCLIKKAEFGVYIPQDASPEKKLELILSGLQYSGNVGEYYSAANISPVAKDVQERIISAVCKKKYVSDVAKLLDDLKEIANVGTKACNKKEFCNIVFTMFDKMDEIWKIHSYSKCKHILSQYYGVKEPTYKVSNCDEYWHTETGGEVLRAVRKAVDRMKKK